MSINLSTSWSTNVRIIRLVDQRLESVRLDLTMDLDFNSNRDDHLSHQHLNRMRTWVDEVLDDCVVINVHDETDTSMLGEVQNNVMFCPEEPHDYLLLTLITSKLNAIGCGYVTVLNSTLKVDTSDGFSLSLSGDTDDLLPSGEEWMSSVRYWEEPWWNRPDGGMMDIPVLEGEDPSIKPDILIDLGDELPIPKILEKDTPTLDVLEKSAEIIRPDFKRKSRDD